MHAGAAIALTRSLPGGPLSPDSSVSALDGGGSDRFFMRIQDGTRSVVALVQPGAPEEFASYLLIGTFLQKNGIGVPRFHAWDEKAGILVLEERGGADLQPALREAGPEEELSFYREGMQILFELQTVVTSALETDPPPPLRRFDEATLLGETDYFAVEFVPRFCPAGLPDGWEKERRALAGRLSTQPPVFMHRDFQSRNLFVKEGRLRVIDFQTAHMGPGLYDAASFLKDPYHPLIAGTRRTLLMELFYRLKEIGRAGEQNFEEYYETFLMAGIQRNLQALAAFARLGIGKGKTRFLESILPGLDSLEEGVDESGSFPAIGAMARDARKTLKRR